MLIVDGAAIGVVVGADVGAEAMGILERRVRRCSVADGFAIAS
jgi:hypothetical protein